MNPEEWLQGKLETDPKFRVIAEDARIFGELMEQPGWQRLIERIEREKDEYLHDIARRLLDGRKEIAVDQREIDFMAGFYKGALYVLKHPEVAEKSFTKAAHLAWVLDEADQEVDDVPSPYA